MKLITADALIGSEEADVLRIGTDGMHSLATVVDFFRQLPTVDKQTRQDIQPTIRELDEGFIEQPPECNLQIRRCI